MSLLHTIEAVIEATGNKITSIPPAEYGWVVLIVFLTIGLLFLALKLIRFLYRRYFRAKFRAAWRWLDRFAGNMMMARIFVAVFLAVLTAGTMLWLALRDGSSSSPLAGNLFPPLRVIDAINCADTSSSTCHQPYFFLESILDLSKSEETQNTQHEKLRTAGVPSHGIINKERVMTRRLIRRALDLFLHPLQPLNQDREAAIIQLMETAEQRLADWAWARNVPKKDVLLVLGYEPASPAHVICEFTAAVADTQTAYFENPAFDDLKNVFYSTELSSNNTAYWGGQLWLFKQAPGWSCRLAGFWDGQCREMDLLPPGLPKKTAVDAFFVFERAHLTRTQKRSRGLYLYVNAGLEGIGILRRNQRQFCDIAVKEDAARAQGVQRQGRETFVVGGQEVDAGGARKLSPVGIVRYVGKLTRRPGDIPCGIVPNPDLLTARPEKDNVPKKSHK